MKRYYNDEPDDFFEESDEDEDEELLARMFSDEPDIIFGEWESNLLASAINFLSMGFFWKFKNYKTRLKEIQEVYTAFHMLTNPLQEEE